MILSRYGIVKNNQDNINISLFEAFGNLTIFCLKYFLKKKRENKICPFGSDFVWEKIKRKNSSSTMRLLTTSKWTVTINGLSTTISNLIFSKPKCEIKKRLEYFLIDSTTLWDIFLSYRTLQKINKRISTIQVKYPHYKLPPMSCKIAFTRYTIRTERYKGI